MFVLMCGAVLAGQVVGDDETAQESKFSDKITVPSNFGFAQSVSDDGQVVTLLFDNLIASVSPVTQGARGTHNQTAIETKVFSVNIPYSTKQRSVKMFMDVRGYVSVDPDAVVRLVACAGDTTTAIGLEGQEGDVVELEGTSKEAHADQREDGQFNDFQERVEFTVQTHAKKPVCQITLFLLAEHSTDESGGALLAVNSLDISIASDDEKKDYDKKDKKKADKP
jgi:hypothetical protein